MSALAVQMLARGVAPCLDCGPINRIKLQERKSGYRIDDFVIYAGESPVTAARRLLVQVALGIAFTASDPKCRDTVVAAWRDFNDGSIFAPGRDAIAIVTGPLSAADTDGLRTILDWARARASAQEFFTDIALRRLSSDLMREKLDAIRSHINAAAGSAPSDEEVFRFLRHLHVLGYDLDVRSGVTHSFLRTIIGCFQPNTPGSVWARILEEVGFFDVAAGTLTVESFSSDIREAFEPRVVEVMPESLASRIPPKEVRE